METIIGIGIIVLIITIFSINKHKQKRIFLTGTGKVCTITAGSYSLCTPPIQGDMLNGKLQEKKVLYYRELKRESIYHADDGFQIVGITYEYWDSIPETT